MDTTKEHLKIRVIIELFLIASLTVIFLFVFPSRNILVDISLACLALLLVALNFNFARTEISCLP